MVQIYCICNAGHGFDADESSGLSRGRRRLPDHGYRVLRTEKDIYLPISRRYGIARTKTCRATYSGPGDEAVPDAFAGTPAAQSAEEVILPRNQLNFSCFIITQSLFAGIG